MAAANLWAYLRAGTFLFLFCFLQVHVAAQPQQPEAQVRNRVSGTVVSSVTHEPIGRALVFSLDNRYATFSDNNGHFEIDCPAAHLQRQSPGSVYPYIQENCPTMLSAKKPGFLDSQRHFQLRPTLVQPGQQDVTVSLIPEALIVGRLETPAASTLGRGRVVLYRREIRDGSAHWTEVKQTSTRSNGEFRFSDLPRGQYKLFSLESEERDPLLSTPDGPTYGYPPAYYPAAHDFATAGIIRLDPGKHLSLTLRPERQRYYPVKVPVLNVSPDRRLSLAVSVFAQGHPGPGFSLGYDPRSQTIDGTLPDGTYSLQLSGFGPGSAAGTTTISLANGIVTGTPVTLAPNGSFVVNVRQDFTKQEALPGADPNALPVFASLEPADEFAEQGNIALEKPEGQALRFSSVPPGLYWIHVNAPLGYAASVNSGGKDLLREPLNVPYGASGSIDIVLRNDTAELEGEIQDPSKPDEVLPQPGALINPFSSSAMSTYVYLLPLKDGSGQYQEVSTGGGSNPRVPFRISQVAPGAYRVLALDQQQELEYRSQEAMQSLQSKGVIVHLAPGQKQHIKLSLIKTEE